MIGIWSTYSNIFLYIAGVAMLAFYGLPLVIVPLRWAKLFGWEVGSAGHLTVMLGRSLGLLLCLLGAFAFVAASNPPARPFFFDMLLWVVAGMAVLHSYNAIRKLQPKLETLEIILWVVLFVLTLCFHPR